VATASAAAAVTAVTNDTTTRQSLSYSSRPSSSHVERTETHVTAEDVDVDYSMATGDEVARPVAYNRDDSGRTVDRNGTAAAEILSLYRRLYDIIASRDGSDG
jgi:hypothetical protein